MLNLQSVYLGSSSQPLEASEKTRIALDSNGVVHIDRGGNIVTLHWDVRNATVIKGEGYDAYVAVGVMPGAPGARPFAPKR